MTPRALAGEALGTAFLLIAVVGSGIMGERLAGGNVALALLANALATGAALVALILAFGRISGAHFNPLVSVADAVQGVLSWTAALAYVAMQVIGAFAGVAVANAMFGQPIFAASTHARSGAPLLLSEVVATFGLLGIVSACSRRNPDSVPFAVGAYITAAYWFTSSTSFANPAVTHFSGIRPADVPAFILAQAVGAASATILFRWLVPARASGDSTPMEI